MLSRCEVDGIEQSIHPTYIGCTVHPDFIKFQDFAAWCHTQIGFGNDWALDKDILIPGNKVYGPDTCCFVPKSINSLLTYKKSNNGRLPIGVTYHKTGRYNARVSVEDVRKCLGYFETPEEAVVAYQSAKLNEIKRQAEKYKGLVDDRIYQALLNYKM